VLESFSQSVTHWAGSSWAFSLALLVIVAWGVTGPLFHFCDTWQLVINTGTTIVTFLMVFLIQRAQNKESQATQLKLNEIVAALDGASARLVNVEDLTEEELRAFHRRYRELAERAKEAGLLTAPHSIDEGRLRRRPKNRQHRQPEAH
jgi:low affinity Fe/Cu permease